MGVRPRGRIGSGMRSKSRWSTMRTRRWSGSSCRELAEPGVARGVLGEDVLLDARALAALGRGAQHRVRRARPAAHHAEAVAHREQRRLVAGPDAGRRGANSGPSQAGSSSMPCDPSVDAVVVVGVDVARARRCRCRRRSGRPAPRGSCAAGAPRRTARGCAGRSPPSTPAQVAGRVLHHVHQRVVAQVRPAVVHVQDGHVDRRAGRRAGRPPARSTRT